MYNKKEHPDMIDLIEQLEKLWEKEDQMLKDLGFLEEDEDEQGTVR